MPGGSIITSDKPMVTDDGAHPHVAPHTVTATQNDGEGSAQHAQILKQQQALVIPVVVRTHNRTKIKIASNGIFLTTAIWHRIALAPGSVRHSRHLDARLLNP